MEEINELQVQEPAVENNGTSVGADGTIKVDLRQASKKAVEPAKGPCFKSGKRNYSGSS